MIDQREDGGKISTPHPIEAFGEKNPPKMGRCDLDWVIISFFIHLDAFRVEKVKELTHEIAFICKTKFGKIRSKTFLEHFEASNNIFWE